MADHLLDTDVLIWFLRGRKETRAVFQEIEAGGIPLCSALSVLEIMFGVREKEEKVTRYLLRSLRVVPVGEKEAEKAASLMRDYRKGGITLDLVDAVIAATCLLHDLVLVTYNRSHYPMPPLKLFKMP
ncbi:MAG: type II toxin-antitoxin system VapC family toxin [Armatimonadetes bacterium]|nr:type II toxin-antitoxin system VapC family toxin [Armatimonadota bacterium]